MVALSPSFDGQARPYDQRPPDERPIHTDELPATPVRDRNIVASAWVEAPPSVVELGRDLGHDQVDYKRRIGDWLLWRSGPATRGDARYVAVDSRDLSRQFTFRLFPDGRGEGTGPSGATHNRFRTWKEDLRDHG